VLTLLLVALASVLTWGAIDPRSQWRVLCVWQYRRPGPHEPSDNAYATARLVCVLALTVLIVLTLTRAGDDVTLEQGAVGRAVAV
jgi:hypothetical protein